MLIPGSCPSHMMCVCGCACTCVGAEGEIRLVPRSQSLVEASPAQPVPFLAEEARPGWRESGRCGAPGGHDPHRGSLVHGEPREAPPVIYWHFLLGLWRDALLPSVLGLRNFLPARGSGLVGRPGSREHLPRLCWALSPCPRRLAAWLSMPQGLRGFLASLSSRAVSLLLCPSLSGQTPRGPLPASLPGIPALLQVS